MELSGGLRVILKGHLDWGKMPVGLFCWDAIGLSAAETHEPDATGLGLCLPGGSEIALSAIAEIFSGSHL